MTMTSLVGPGGPVQGPAFPTGNGRENDENYDTLEPSFPWPLILLEVRGVSRDSRNRWHT